MRANGATRDLAVQGAAEAVKQAGRHDVKVIGLALPNDNRRYIKENLDQFNF